MKIKFICPAPAPYWSGPLRATGKKTLVPPLSLLTVAGLTPEGIEIAFTDENVDEIDFDDENDMVAISAITITAPRAYQIADAFRERGVTVVLGGIHPSALPHEAIRHADAVVIGEAEGVWPRLIADYEAGKLQKFYRNDTLPSLENLPLPRRDLLKKGAYILPNTVQTTRGCPFGCKFCSVTHFFGHTYRFRPIAEVMDELEKLEAKHVFFVDDNIAANPRRAKELFRALIPLGIKWGSQASLTIVGDVELLQLAAKSGCIYLIIGFESVSQASLLEVGKTINRVGRYKDAIKKLHDNGIIVYGTFVFGFDHDDETIFEKTLEFTMDAKIDAAGFMILTPYPSTPFYKEFKEEGRLMSESWSDYYVTNVVFQPKLMSADALLAGEIWALRNFYSWKSICKRLWGLTFHLPWRLGINLLQRKRVQEIAASIQSA